MSVAFVAGIASCYQPSIATKAKRVLISDSLLNRAHIGIAVYNLTAQHWLYRYQADHYFIPASNTKLFSTAAMLENVGDRVPGLEYLESDTAVWLKPT
ncbi:MAG TPA: D-alanyl-D-alanine carboxypeptidase, partial [Ferruginibacter sp.]|nr:D-alanyl-D-alanine carboxypeptidase [Ferruginibacter sp.]